jgi:signal transduction histidine kinase/outer membrane murein-binding lipoprotein Lpp
LTVSDPRHAAKPPLFLVRVAGLPVALVVLLAVLFQMGGTAIRTQQDAMNAVVQTDLEGSAHLGEINSRLQAANAEMYHIITQVADRGAAADGVQHLAARIDGIIADLDRYRKSNAAAGQAASMDRFIEDLSTYKGAIDWLGSMLEVDFRAAAAFIEPYNAHVDKLSAEINAIIAENTRTAKTRAEDASAALRQVAVYYVVAAVAVCLMVFLFSYVTGTRLARLYGAAKQRTEQVAALLDNSGQGFLTVGPGGIVGQEFSQACIQILGRAPAGLALPHLLFPDAGQEDRQDLVDTALDRAFKAVDPTRRSILLSLLPTEIALGDTSIQVEYKPLPDGTVMVVLTDVTEARVLAEQVRQERKRLEMIVAAVGDGHEFFSAVEDCDRFLDWELDAILASDAPPAAILDEVYRQVHTFKGTFNQFSFQHLPLCLHAAESALHQLKATETADTAAIRAIFDGHSCRSALDADMGILRQVLGDVFVDGRGTIRLTLEEVKSLEALAAKVAAQGDAEGRDLARRVALLRQVSLRKSLGDFNRLVQRIAERRGKEVEPLSVQGDDISVASDRLVPFLRSLGHVFRNAVDHGIENPEERLMAGKPESGHITCTILGQGDGSVIIEVADDGRGIDVAALRAQLGQDSDGLSDQQVMERVFGDGVTTADGADDISGRGVGLAAVWEATRALGGQARLLSEPGRGTRFIFTMPDLGERA